MNRLGCYVQISMSFNNFWEYSDFSRIKMVNFEANSVVSSAKYLQNLLSGGTLMRKTSTRWTNTSINFFS